MPRMRMGGDPMSDDLHRLIRDAITQAATESPAVVTDWIFAYQTTDIDSDGDTGGATGVAVDGSISAAQVRQPRRRRSDRPTR